MASFQERGPLAPVSAFDFLLGPEAFVDQCANAFGLSEDDLTQLDRGTLADAIKAGRPRFEIIDTIRARRDPLDPNLQRPSVCGVPSQWSSFVIPELLERFAPEDDEAFLRQAFSQLLSREPTSLEVVESIFDLKRGRVSRRHFIEMLAERVKHARTSPDPSMNAKAAPENKPFKILLAKHIAGEGMIWAPDAQIRASRSEDGMLYLDQGWIVTGPKRSLPPGAWRLDFEIVQPDSAEVVLDVVANSGLDILAAMTLAGPAQFSLRVEVKKWHHFIEARLFKPAQPEPLNRLKIREISLMALT